ncbi:MAG: hypothetical protein ABI297_02300 [Ginsengibacter sp.]
MSKKSTSFKIKSQLSKILVVCICMISLTAVSQDTSKVTETFKPSGKISGYAFGDYAYKLHADSALRGNLQYSKLPKNYSSFNFRRIYLQYDYHFSPNISSQLLLAHESTSEVDLSSSNVLTDNNRAFYIKAMNISFKNIIPQATIVAGQQATPTFSRLSETVWGYRSIEKTIVDMRGISSSNDLGVGIYGKIGKNENVGYDIMVGNSNGAKVEIDKYKKIYTSMYFYFLDKKLVLQGNFEHDKTASVPLQKNINNFKAFAGYKTSTTAVGVEAFTQLKTNNIYYLKGIGDSVYTDVRRSGISFFMTRQLTKNKLNLFARFDLYNPDSKYNNSHNYESGYNTTKEMFATLGLDFIPYKNVHIMPNLWVNQYHSKLPGASGDLRNDYDLAGRITLYFLFNK